MPRSTPDPWRVANHKPVQVVVGPGELVRMKAPRDRSGSYQNQGSAKPYVSTKEFFPMGIFSRTRDIIAANVTDLLDKAEDPAKMIRMIILEMEETLVEVTAAAARTRSEEHTSELQSQSNLVCRLLREKKKTPLNALVGMSDLLLNTNLGLDQQDYAETINNSTDSLLVLITNILAYPKIESGKMHEQEWESDACLQVKQ